ncbi:hypothetical protein UFOVP369_52 [uncultured Caudovirales phage]|uniref:Uncharacterized protein n=1 Tax=uncultured Caudovirales phage TaxID=2100421 RepID=A0A6J7WY99_9CAUD|nr:hypothetical protein UFOVP369_52 [uncultured Caudovirales phage]
MATIVPGLFGKSSVDVEAETQKRIDDFLNVSRQRTGPGSGKRQLGASSGVLIGQALKGLFGYKSPAEESAAKNEDMAKYFNQIVDDETRKDPGKYYSLAAEVANKFGDYTRGDQLTQLALDKGADYQYKQSQIKNNELEGTKKELEVNALKAEELGMVANGFLTAYDKATDDATKDKVWNNTLTTLKNKGVDITIPSELPMDQRSIYLQSLVDGSENSSTRFKNTKLAIDTQVKYDKMEQDNKINAARNDLTNQKMDLMVMLTRERIGSNEKIALENRLNGIDKQLQGLDISSAWRSQAEASSKVNTKEHNMNIRKYLSETVELGDKDLPKALLDFNTVYKTYLDEKDMDPKSPNYLKPKYSSNTAFNMTQQLIESKVGKEKTWLGLGSKTTYSNAPTTTTKETTVSTETPPVNLLKEGANTAFDNGQVWSLKDGKPIRVK